jgi:hypothetical protein
LLGISARNCTHVISTAPSIYLADMRVLCYSILTPLAGLSGTRTYGRQTLLCPLLTAFFTRPEAYSFQNPKEIHWLELQLLIDNSRPVKTVKPFCGPTRPLRTP